MKTNHPTTFHVEGETPTFGYPEVRTPPVGVPCEDECAETVPPPPVTDPAIEQGIKDGTYPPW